MLPICIKWQSNVFIWHYNCTKVDYDNFKVGIACFTVDNDINPLTCHYAVYFLKNFTEAKLGVEKALNVGKEFDMKCWAHLDIEKILLGNEHKILTLMDT